MENEVSRLLRKRDGHFVLESGHHGELWLDLELLFLDPAKVQPLVSLLCKRLAPHKPDAVCGPLVEGAFVALGIAAALGVRFAYSERFVAPDARGPSRVAYRIPAALQSEIRGKRVAIVDDVINAASAVRGTSEALRECGAVTVALGALAVLGDAAAAFATEEGVGLEALASFANRIWEPSSCPLCARGIPLDRSTPTARHDRFDVAG